MSCLEQYTALIQLISAVNFAYIATHFPTKVFGMIFDENSLLYNKLFYFRNEVAADIQSLAVMQPMTMSDGRTNANMINNLREEYNGHKEKWDQEVDAIITSINTAKNVKGSKCLFLNISLFCILTLFNIGTFGILKNDFMLVFTLLVNIGTLLYSMHLTYIMWGHKWDNESDMKCYKKTGYTIILIFLTALFTSFINHIAVSQVGASPIPDWLSRMILSLSIFLPFYPCIISVIFIVHHERKIIKRIDKETEMLIAEQQKLHKNKEMLDSIDDYFTQPQWSVGKFT